MPWRAQPGPVQHLLHQLLVAERLGLRAGQPGQAEFLAQPGREHHVRLPQALDPFDPDVPGQPADRRDDGRLVGQ